MAATKKELRTKYKKLRQDLTQNEIRDLSVQISEQCLALDIWSKNVFHVFLSIQSLKEVDTQPLIQTLQRCGKTVVVSKADFQTLEMKHFLYTTKTVVALNSWQIPEPIAGVEINDNQIQVVFVPLLAVDLGGNRTGYGKGFYDRFLAKCKPNTIKIGLSFFEPENTLLDADANDMRLDMCVIPKKIFVF